MSKILSLIIGLSLLLGLGTSILLEPSVAHAGYDASNLISDGEFTAWQTMDANGVQQFLNTRGGTRLRTYSEGGLTAAQIIANAARTNGINPFVILATMQKEESIVDSNYNFDYRVVWAMGYGVCDSCALTDPNTVKYRGFTNQVSNATWQLKRNYSYWAANGSAWNVGRTMMIDDAAIRFANRSTSSLYRYTPHLSGNGNFYDIYNSYKGFRPAQSYEAQLTKVIVPKTIRPGQKIKIFAYYKNTGTALWSNSGANPVRLGNSNPNDRGSVMTGGSNQRWQMLSKTAAKNRVGVFMLETTAPQAGTYVERYRPLMEGVTWFGDEATITFNVGGSAITTKGSTSQVNGQSNSFDAQYVSQSVPKTLKAGQKYTIYVYMKNTGSNIWSNSGANPVRLGNSSPNDRGSVMTGGANTRWNLVPATLASQRTSVFKIQVTAPTTPGTYTEKYRPLAEGSTWFGAETTVTYNVIK